MSARTQNKYASAIAEPEIETHDLKEGRAARQAEIDALQIRLDEAECLTRDLQAQVSTKICMGHRINATEPLAIALRNARDQANQLRTAIERTTIDREELATVRTRFVECAKTFGAEIESDGWASYSDVPADALAACLDPMIVALAADQVSVPRIFSQIRHTVEKAVPVACFPFMPCELFDTSGAVRALILERIRQVVKDADDHPRPAQMQVAI